MKILKQSLVIFVLGSIPFFYFCKSPKDIVQKEFELQQVHDTIAYLDLSHKGLKELPKELARMNVKKLNLSYNDLKTVDFKQLPYALEEVDFSHNKLDGYISVFKKDQVIETLPVFSKHSENANLDSKPTMFEKLILSYRKIDLSYNKIDSVNVNPKVFLFDLSQNELKFLSFNSLSVRGKPIMDTLNISNNPDFSNIVNFTPETFKKIYHKNIKNDKPLEFQLFN